jgi:hypothetical protein
MKITTHRSKSTAKKVEEPKKVVKAKEEIPKYKIILPKEEKKIEPLFSPEVEKLLVEDEEDIDE